MTRTTPFDEMDRLFERMRRSMLGGNWMAGDANLRMETTDDGYLVHADLPGFEREDLDLRFEDGVLTIDAAHEATDEGHARSRRMHESVRVPCDVIVEEIDADYHNGVLEIRIPTDDAPEDGHRIDVN
ncbi:Hsp20/alpha crystallin family protein [Natronomonas halophila]|uniref:Hsp20/alpha crystallin family protein n=1 Tax=Natronomonas halophila TaxID=2747817 RepID=UPI0015B687CC|nr:Hsp20/alpha crystallin family protein [Natronomonas halophila]QLD87159.1 Hsp20/alpha crystallin family protein [Natronomonas halophila]